MADAIEVLQDGYPLRLARAGAIVFADLWDPDPSNSPDIMAALRDLVEVILEDHPRGTILLRVRSGSGLPDSQKRARMERWLRERGSSGEGIIWLEGEGFWAAAFRALLSAFLMATGRRALFTIVPSLDALVAAAELDDAQRQAVTAFFVQAHPAEAA